jgi:hypothetical protein
MPNLRARTKTACRVAGVDPDRFNELVAAGHYPCAPRTTAGVARVFTVNDIVALRVYAYMVDEGTIPSKAGPLACGLAVLLKVQPHTHRAVCVKPSLRSVEWLASEEFAFESTHMGGLEIISVREWRLEPIRARIVHELEEEAAVVGED